MVPLGRRKSFPLHCSLCGAHESPERDRSARKGQSLVILPSRQALVESSGMVLLLVVVVVVVGVGNVGGGYFIYILRPTAVNLGDLHLER